MKKVHWKKISTNEWELSVGGEFAGAIVRNVLPGGYPTYAAYGRDGVLTALYGTLAEAKRSIKAR